MITLPTIDFGRIRGLPPSGSQQAGFEELGSQLMIDGGLVAWPAGVVFSKFGNPDGGREGRGELPDGSTWCWQTKYLFELDAEALTQIDESVHRAITREPTMTRYYVLMPFDLPAGDWKTAKREAKSAFTKWREYVAKWQTAAAAAGIEVAFHYIGAFQMGDALLKPAQAGRLHYWFGLDSFTPDRYREIADRAAADAGGRYSPQLNVGLPIAEVFDGLVRQPKIVICSPSR